MAGKVARKLTPQQVLDIRALLASGTMSLSAIGRKFSIGPSSIWRIKRQESYNDIPTEDNLYSWHVVEKKVITLNYFTTKSNRDSYCGFKFTSYALRKYGKKSLNAFIDAIAFCDHGELCEECCFNYTGPEAYGSYVTKKHCLLPTSLFMGPPLKEPIHIAFEVTFYMRLLKEECILRACRNRRCANPHHVEIVMGKGHASTRQKTQSDD